MSTTRYLVPIRFWEDSEPIAVEPIFGPNSGNLYYHPRWGHSVILSEANLFDSYEECAAEIARRVDTYRAELDAEVARVMASIRGTGC